MGTDAAPVGGDARGQAAPTPPRTRFTTAWNVAPLMATPSRRIDAPLRGRSNCSGCKSKPGGTANGRSVRRVVAPTAIPSERLGSQFESLGRRGRSSVAVTVKLTDLHQRLDRAGVERGTVHPGRPDRPPSPPSRPATGAPAKSTPHRPPEERRAPDARLGRHRCRPASLLLQLDSGGICSWAMSAGLDPGDVGTGRWCRCCRRRKPPGRRPRPLAPVRSLARGAAVQI